MRNLKTIFDFIIEDESGQGATEYILLVVVVVAIVFVFKQQIMGFINQKMQDIQNGMGQITTGAGGSGG